MAANSNKPDIRSLPSSLTPRVPGDEVDQDFIAKNYKVLLCGAPRVGKSALVNALCGKNLAKTSTSLDSCTKNIHKYRHEGTYTTPGNQRNVKFCVKFYDTPGIESWKPEDVKSYVDSIMKKAKPLCLIYCASPGCFVKLDQLQVLVDTCVEKDIFCALVCTNMWSGNSRRVVIDELKKTFAKHQSETKEEAGVSYFGNIGLVTLINSEEYIDEKLKIKKPISGIEQLIEGVAKSLTGDQLEGWFYTVMNSRSPSRELWMEIQRFFKSAVERILT